MLDSLTTVSLALSLFTTFAMAWLGLTVLLAAGFRKPFALLAGTGLLLGMLFFLSHGMIVARGETASGSGMQFWWRLGWVPAIAAPLTWYATVLRYAGLDRRRLLRLHVPLLATLAALAVVVLIMAVAANPFAQYDSLRTLAAPIEETPLLIRLYLILAVLSFTLPLTALFVASRQNRTTSAGEARPWLAGTNVLLALASIATGYLASWAVRNALPILFQNTNVMVALFAGDVFVLVLIALAVVVLGRAVVAHEVFTERPLPRQGALTRWYGVLAVSAVTAAIIAIAHYRGATPVYSLSALGLTFILTLAFFGWQTLTSQERFISGLLPFVASVGLTSLSPQQRQVAEREFEREGRRLLAALCDAVDAPASYLSLPAYPNRELGYRWQHGQPSAPQAVAVRLGNAGAYGELWLMRRKGTPYTNEELALARACGERLLDALAGDEISGVMLRLVNQRITAFNLFAAQHKRVIHDDVLPDLHLALLALQQSNGDAPTATDIDAARQAITDAHRQLSELLRATPHTPGAELAAVGLKEALARAISRQFADAFSHVTWQWPDQARALSDLPGLSLEVLYYAAVEGIRNAANHAATSDGTGPTLALALELDADTIRLCIRDNGTGSVAANRAMIQRGAGEGLLLHTAMMAVVGGTLKLHQTDDGATLTLSLNRQQQTATP